MQYNFLLEASGTLISGFMIKAVKSAGARAIASDIEECAATYQADEFIVFPKFRDPNLWEITKTIIQDKNINVVVPTLDETILKWADQREEYAKIGVHVLVSDKETIAVFQDKWKTFQFFEKIGVPQPNTSLSFEFPLVKPRNGRGGKGILIHPDPTTLDMEGMISQELLKGTEYTIDVFCSLDGVPIYIIPRKRLQIKDGKSTNGVTVYHPEIEKWVKKICSEIKFKGPINLQCFETPEGEIKFTEINPRLGGGSALGFAASENWATLMINHLIEAKEIHPLPIKWDLKMYRYYNEVFV
jgi:carbamoyl-phosphate synthase large subunit